MRECEIANYILYHTYHIASRNHIYPGLADPEANINTDGQISSIQSKIGPFGSLLSRDVCSTLEDGEFPPVSALFPKWCSAEHRKSPDNLRRNSASLRLAHLATLLSTFLLLAQLFARKLMRCASDQDPTFDKTSLLSYNSKQWLTTSLVNVKFLEQSTNFSNSRSPARSRVYFDVQVGGKKEGCIVFELVSLPEQ